MKYRLFVLIALTSLSCADKQQAPFKLPVNAPVMIASVGGKTWRINKKYINGNPIELDTCDQNYRITFLLNGSISSEFDNGTYCSVVPSGKWMIQLNKDGSGSIEIKMQNETKKGLKLQILDLSDHFMKWQYSERNSYGKRVVYQETLIPDITN